jgi:hypothetical protein
VVSNGKFVRAAILPLREKIPLVERRKVVERELSLTSSSTEM